MANFVQEFVMEMFLETDSISTMNRLVVAAANVISENNDNVSLITQIMKKEHTNMVELSTEDIDSPETSPVAKKRRKVFYEHEVLNYTEEEYEERFKMRRSTVQALINLLKEHVDINSTNAVALDKKVHVFLYLITSDASYGEVGSLFGLHKSSVSYIFHEIASLIAEQRHNFITWPTVEAQHLTRIKVNSRFKFPNCVGFIDVCRFRVGTKKNKKKKPEIVLLQAVCDTSLAFIDIHLSNGSIRNKNKLFKESSLCNDIKNLIEFENHILGDSEYKLRKNLMTPFSSEEVLTNEEMKFNEIHWKARGYIGHAFEVLKERFTKLNHIDSNKREYVNTLIYAACVLHNFALFHEGCSEVKEEPVTCDDTVTIDTNIAKTAEDKRIFLCNYIYFMLMNM